MSTFGGPGPSQYPHDPQGFPPNQFAPPAPGQPVSVGAAPVPAKVRGSGMVAGGLLILLAVLLAVGSLLTLAEFRSDADPASGLVAFHQQWRAWELITDGNPDVAGDSRQLLGIPMILAAVLGAVGAILLLTGLATRRRGAFGVAVAAAGMMLGVAAAAVADLVSAWMTADRTTSTSLGPGFYLFALALPVAVGALAMIAVVGAATRPGTPVDSYGRPLSRKASGIDIVVGLLLMPVAVLMVAATFFDQESGVTLWSAWNDKLQITGLPLVAGAVAALVAAVLSFLGRGRVAASACAATLLTSGLLLSLDTVDLELSGSMRIANFNLGAWLLFASTILALIVTVLAVISTATKPGFRTPYTPVPQQYPGWAQPAPAIATPPPTWVQPPQNPPHVPQARPQNSAPSQPVWPQPEQGWQQPPQGQ